MKVLVNGKVHDSIDTPVVLFLTDEDRGVILERADDDSCYGVYPDRFDAEQRIDHIERVAKLLRRA